MTDLLLTSDPNPGSSRPSWDDYFLGLVDAAATRATCDRGRCGALLVYQRQQVVTGYVGSPPGFPHCDDVGHELVDGHCVRTVHAEQNAIASAARFGVQVIGSTLYSTLAPCRVCAMLLIAVGVDRVVTRHAYQDDLGLKILTQAGIEWTVHDPRVPYAATK